MLRIFWILLALGLSTPTAAAPSAESVAAARLRQELLPSLKKRLETAKERIKSADAYFKGDAELEVTWPELSGAPLLSKAYVQGQLARLQTRDEARVAERLSATPADLKETDAKLWRKALNEALDAEAVADQQERQLWTALLLGLQAAPLLREEALEAQVSSWRAETAELPPPDDPGYAEAAQAAALAGDLEVVLGRYRLAAVRTMTVPEDLSLVRLVTVDLLRQGASVRSPVESEAAADRLRRVQPLLPAALREEVQQALDAREIARLEEELAVLQGEVQAVRAQRTAVVESATEQTPAILKEAVATQQAALERVRAETAVLLAAAPPPEADLLAQRQRAVAALRLELAEQRLSLANFRLHQASSTQVRSPEEGAIRAQVQVDDAQRKAEEAQRKAEAAGKARLQALAEALRQLSTAVAEAEQERQAEALASIQGLQGEQRAHLEAIVQAEGVPPALRQDALRTAYVEQLRWMSTLRSAQRSREASVKRLVADNARIRRDEIPPEEELVHAADADPDLVGSVQETIDAILEALAERQAQALREQDQVTRLLVEARIQKRRLRERLSASSRASAEREAEVDPIVRAVEELADVPRVLGAQFRLLQDTQAWNLRAVVRQVVTVLLRSVEVVILLLGWYVLRQNAARWLERGLLFLQQVLPRARNLERQQLLSWLSTDLSGLVKRLSPVIPPAADVLAAFLVYRLSWMSPLLGILMLLWLAGAILRLRMPLVNLLVVTEPTTSFALLHVRPETREQIHRTTRRLIRWWLLAILLHQMAYSVMGTDFLSERLRAGVGVISVGLVCWEVLRWAPIIRETIAARGGNSRLIRWMTDVPRGSVGIFLRATVGIGYLSGILASRGATLLVEGRGGWGWVGSLIAQHSLQELDQTCTPIPDADRLAIVESGHDGGLHTEELDQLRAHYAAWCEEQRRGLVALIGDRGAGKGRILLRLGELGEAEGRATVRLVPLERTTEAAPVRSWLAEGFGLPDEAAESWVALRRALLASPSRVVLLEDTHRLLLRAVGGFANLRDALDLMQATSSHHFWICAFHAPTWSFLEGAAVSINLEVFRAQVRLAPLAPGALAAWALQATTTAGFTVRFDNLATAGVRTADLGGELIRIESAFWRRLNDISQGNPQVAFRYWLDSLRLPAPTSPPPPPAAASAAPAAVSAAPRYLDVSLLDPPDSSDVEDLPDVDLFVLTAIVIHDGLTAGLLARSLNLPLGQILASCRHLGGLGVLRRDGSIYRLQVPWRPAILRLLRQKHLHHPR